MPGAAPSEDALRIVVVDTAGELLPGASVALRIGAETRLLRPHATLPGRAMELGDHSGQEMLVWCEGYTTRRLVLRSTDFSLREKLVELQPERTISGRLVTTFSGSSLGGVRVVALRRYGRPSEHEVRDVLQSVPRHASALTQGDGSFSIHGLERELRYSLVASGRGYVTDGIVLTARAGDRDVALPVKGLYGAQVAVSVAGYPEFVSDMENDQTFVDLSEGRFFGRTWLAGFSGLPLGPSFDSASSILVLATAPVDAEQIAPASLSIGRPGLSRSVLEVEMRRVREHLPRFEQRLDVDSPGFGELEVTVELPYELEPPAIGTPGPDEVELGVLCLTRAGSDETLRAGIDLPRLGEDLQRLRGVPFGTYRVAFEAKHGWFEQSVLAEQELKIDAGVTSLHLRPGPSGALHLALALDGQPLSPAYEGPLRLHLHLEGRDSFRSAHLSSPPYVVHCLDPRVLRIEAYLDEAWGELDASRPFVVDDCVVEAGQVKKVVLEQVR